MSEATEVMRLVGICSQVAAEALKLRAENDALKQENSEMSRMLAEPPESAVKIAELTRQRDELKASLERSLELWQEDTDALTARAEAAEKERDEAVQSFRAAIELEGPQKYATLLDERDALAGRLEEANLTLSRRKASYDHAESISREIFIRQRAHNAAMREALKDAMSALRYIRQTNGRLDGVGWERVEQSALAALNPTA